MSTLLERLPETERAQILDAEHGDLKDLCAELGLNYHSVRAAKSRLNKKLALSDVRQLDDLSDEDREWLDADLDDWPEAEMSVMPEIDEIDAGSYEFDGDLLQYVTRLKRAPHSITMSKAKHERLRRRWSSYGGKGASREELVRESGLPWEWLQEYARIHKWSKAGLPFTTEELETREIEDLVSEAKAFKEVKVERKLHQLEWDEYKRDAARWRQAEREMWHYMDAIPETYQAPALSIPYGDPTGFAVILSTADLHFGKYGYGRETGDGYNRQIARERLIDTTTSVRE